MAWTARSIFRICIFAATAVHAIPAIPARTMMVPPGPVKMMNRIPAKMIAALMAMRVQNSLTVMVSPGFCLVDVL